MSSASSRPSAALDSAVTKPMMRVGPNGTSTTRFSSCSLPATGKKRMKSRIATYSVFTTGMRAKNSSLKRSAERTA